MTISLAQHRRPRRCGPGARRLAAVGPGAADARPPVDVSGRRRRAPSRRCGRPGAATRRRPGHRALVRAARPGRPAGRSRGCRGRCGCCRRSLAASTCRRSWPGCASSTGSTGRCCRGAGHRVRLAARVRDRRRRALHRLAGHRPARATSWSAPGGPNATGASSARARHRPDRGGPGRRRAAAGRRDGRRAAAGARCAVAAAGDRVDLLAADRPVRGPRARRRRGPSAARGRRRRHGPARGRAGRDRLARRWSPRCSRSAAQRCLVVLLTALNPAAVETGCCPCSRALTARHELLVARGRRPAARRDGRRARRRRRRLRGRGRGRAGPRAAVVRVGAAAPARRRPSWTRRRTGCRRARRRLPRRSRPPAGCDAVQRVPSSRDAGTLVTARTARCPPVRAGRDRAAAEARARSRGTPPRRRRRSRSAPRSAAMTA